MTEAASAPTSAVQAADQGSRTGPAEDTATIAPSTSRMVLIEAEETEEGEWEEGEMVSQPSISPTVSRAVELPDWDRPRMVSGRLNILPQEVDPSKDNPGSGSSVQALQPAPPSTEARPSPPMPQPGPRSSPISPISISFPTPRLRSDPVARRTPLILLERSPLTHSRSASPSPSRPRIRSRSPIQSNGRVAPSPTMTRSEVATTSIWPTRGRTGDPRSQLRVSSSSALSGHHRDTRPASTPSRHGYAFQTRGRASSSPPPSCHRHLKGSPYASEEGCVPTRSLASSSNRHRDPSPPPRRRSLSPLRPSPVGTVPQRSFTSSRYNPLVEPQQPTGTRVSRPSHGPAPRTTPLSQPARGRSINPPHRAGSPTRDGVRGPPRQSLSHHAGHRQEPLPLFQRKAELCRRWKQDLPCNRGRYCRFAHGPHELGEPWILPPTKEQRSIETARQEGYASSRRFPIRSVSPPESRVPERRIRNRPFHETALCKTIICRYWRLDMKCPNGSRCAYAHGPRELREFVLPAMETTARWKDRSELDAPSEQGHREARTFLGRREPNRSLSPGETRVRDGQRRRLEEERIRKPPRSSSSPPLKTHSGPVPETARKRRRSIDLSWAQGLSKTARKRRNRRLSASSTGSGSSGLDEMDPRRRDRSLNPSVPPRIKRDESSDCEFEDDQHIVYSHVYPIAEDEDDAPGAEDNEDAYSPLYSPFSIIDTGSEPTPQSRARSVLSPFLETTRAPQSPLVPMPSTAPMPVLPSASPPAVTSVAPTPAPAPAPRPLSPVVVEDRLVPSDRDYFRTYFAELARRKKTVQPIF